MRDPTSNVRTRFAPSPTGSLHVGNARIAVLNWLWTRNQGGTFILRIEDTDTARHDEAAEASIIEDLEWLGLIYEEGPDPSRGRDRGDHGPYRQSERLAIYASFADRLRTSRSTYDCYCPPDTNPGDGPRPECTCAQLSALEGERLLAEGVTPALRFRVTAGETNVHDVVRGAIRFDNSEIADFVIMRADGRPTYNFAVVVDDITMDISHVIRGSGHLSNTPRQVMLYDALGHRPPVFAHVPTVLGPDRQKLSKRHGARALADYRAEGYHPDALVNYLSLLSWSSPTGEEVLDREQLIEEISLERVGVADVVFDPVKLDWLSSKHLERMSLDDLVDAVTPYARRSGWLAPDGPIAAEILTEAVAAVRTHLSKLSDIARELAPFFPQEALPPGVAAVARVSNGGQDAGPDVGGAPDSAGRSDSAPIVALRTGLAELADWDPDSLGVALKSAIAQSGVRGKAFYEPVRLALTGHPHGPPLVAVLRVQGRARVLGALSGPADGKTAGE